MLVTLAIFALGLVLLTLGAKWLVEGSSGIALHFGIRPIIVGMTVVAFGTSMPEFVFNLAATLQGSNDLGLGNIVGSNIANIALVLGVSAIINPIKIDKSLIKVEYPIILATSVLFYLMSIDGQIGQLDGIILFAIFIGFLVYMIKTGSNGNMEGLVEIPETESTKSKSSAKNIGFAILGLLLLIGGARLMVDSAVEIARTFHVSELVIGLTIIAIGTSLPELAASVMSTLKKEADISLGNVLGSNIFNILLVIGLLSIFIPTQAEGDTTLFLHFPAMLLVTLLLLPLLWLKEYISRLDGVLFVILYVIYLFLCYKFG
ncbi:calcium/sodium antiporter [bacterium]|nr:MAG: calcium/sodium antiporter [bacterium]